jgi:menaquinol-cytochrome c reductase iron-sulfur subunit
VPILGYLTSPLLAKQQRGEWIRLGKTASFMDTANPRAVQFTLIRQDGWIEVKKAATCWVVSKGDQFTVFNGRCTHLGCAYGWQTHGKYANVFYCPCHDGVFNPEGEVIGGPPPRPLDKLETKVENGELFVLYQDFRLGVSEKDSL